MTTEEKATLRETILQKAPDHMTIINPEKWQEIKDDYGDGVYEKGILEYADLWARLMEASIASGEKLEDVADNMSYLADVKGVSGFMHRQALSVLDNVWIYGKDLIKWHNEG